MFDLSLTLIRRDASDPSVPLCALRIVMGR
jgi:hypothetical protein